MALLPPVTLPRATWMGRGFCGVDWPTNDQLWSAPCSEAAWFMSCLSSAGKLVKGVVRPCFQEQDGLVGVLRQAVGEDAAGGTGADDDEVVFHKGARSPLRLSLSGNHAILTSLITPAQYRNNPPTSNPILF